MDAAKKRQLSEIYQGGLLGDTLPFWLTHGVDQQYGGIMTCLDRDGSVVDTDKGVWQQARFTWLLGELYNHVDPRDEWLALAQRSAQFMDEFAFDPLDGRMFFHLTRDGLPIRKRRYAYSESFAAIAYGELAKATGEQQYADKAIRTFQRFIQHNLNPGAAESKFTKTRPTRGLGFPMITIATAQELRESIRLENADALIDEAVHDIQRYHLNEDFQCVLETVGPSGQMIDHFDGRLLNPGHAIEAAWFILWEGKLRNEPQLIRLGCQMLDWMWARGWDREFGGILYFVDALGRPVSEYWHDMKFWWPQNETIIATLLAFCLTGDPKYAQWHAMIHEWSYRHFPDALHGEWFGYLHRDGRLSNSLKGNLWKGPFHLPRMQLICWKLLDA